MENIAQQALSLLRNRMSGADLRQLSETELRQFKAICLHWQAMAEAEYEDRTGTNDSN